MALSKNILINKTNDPNFDGTPLLLNQSTNYDRGAWFVAMAKNWGNGTASIEVSPYEDGGFWVPLINPNTGQQYKFTEDGTAFMPKSQNLRIRAIFRDGVSNQEVSIFMM